MPDIDGLSPCQAPDGRFRQFERFMTDGGSGGKDNKKFPDRGYTPIDISPVVDVPSSATPTESPSPKKPRAKESSKHFGVRFRPDLQKWVAEIRVFEWKSVDKKVWLGTFESEEGAARAVDAARKLLQCQKKRMPNFPCAALSAYNESIPLHLQLTNITEEGMFKEVTVFVKRKAQEYAAGFCTSKGATAVGLREQLVAPQQYQIQVGDGNGCFHLTSDVESRQLFTVPEDDVSPTGYSPSSYGTNESYGSYGTHRLPSCDGVMSHHWGSPTSITYSSGPSSCSSLNSSAGTSPVGGSWVQVQSNMWIDEALHMEWSQEAQIGDYSLVPPSWEDQMLVPMPVPMGMDDQTTIEVEVMEDLFNMEDMEDDQECRVRDQAIIDPIMNIFLGDEAQVGAQTTYMDGNWTFQQSFNTTYIPLSNSFDNREVC